MNTLNQLICDTANAQTEQLARVRDIAIFADPHGALTEFAIAHLKKHPNARLFLGSRDLLQTFHSLDLADDAGVAQRVFAAGYETEIQLDIFFADARAGFNGRIAPAEIDLALSELPKSLEELRYFVRSLAQVRPLHFIAGGNNKYMTRRQNEVIAEAFTNVFASRGRGKFRCLIGEKMKATVAPYQPCVNSVKLRGSVKEIQLHAVGGVFSGAKADQGGEFLAQTAIADLRKLFSQASNVPPQKRENAVRQQKFSLLDLGAGNGLISRVFADAFVNAAIFATDISADAITSTHLTLLSEILDKRVKISWDDAAHSLPDGQMDFVLLNPPFHDGTKIDAQLVQHLLDAAVQKLRPQGVLYFVHNSHLRYRPELAKRFAEVAELARNPKFTVLRAVKSVANK